MTVNNLKDLRKILEKKIEESLDKEVTNTIRDVMLNNIEETVYDTYEPSQYKRRYEKEGLSDPSNIGGVIVNGELQVFNATAGNPDIYINGKRDVSQNDGDYLAPIIEYGKGYDFSSENGNNGYEKPRPFVENTREELKQTKAHVKALKQGLKNRGINVE